MAPGQGIGRPRLLIAAALVAGACAPQAAPPSSTVVETTTTTSTTTTSTTTTLATTTTSTPPSTVAVDPGEIEVEVVVPEGDGPFPAVVLVHGGGWIAGAPSVMRDLATHLNGEGFLTFNAGYQLGGEVPSFPGALDDLACAVRFAAAHEASDGSVAIVGHSAGAHLSAVIALSGDFYGEDCPVPGTGIPERFVGLAGPYDVARLGIVMVPFFGAGPETLPDAWAAGNPQLLAGENPDLRSLVMYGERDGLVEPRFAIDFHDALLEAGVDSVLEEVEGARHQDMLSPSFVGDLIVVWLER